MHPRLRGDLKQFMRECVKIQVCKVTQGIHKTDQSVRDTNGIAHDVIEESRV